MPFKVKKDGATIPKKVGQRTAHTGTRSRRQSSEDRKVELLQNKVYFEGDVIPDEDIAPSYLEQLEAGDEHINSLIERVSESKSEKSSSSKEASSKEADAPKSESAPKKSESPKKKAVDKKSSE
jgi:hypothetical protein